MSQVSEFFCYCPLPCSSKGIYRCSCQCNPRFYKVWFEQMTRFYQLWLQSLEKKLQRKSIKALRKDLVSVTCEEHKILCGFLSSNVSKIRLKTVNVQPVPPRFERFAETSTLTDSVPLHRPALKCRVALSCVTTVALSVHIFIGNLCWYRNRMVMCEMSSAHGCSF